MIQDLPLLLNQALVCALLALGLQFLYLGARVRPDRAPLAFGLTLLFLAVLHLPAIRRAVSEGPGLPALSGGFQALWHAGLAVALRFLHLASRASRPRVESAWLALNLAGAVAALVLGRAALLGPCAAALPILALSALFRAGRPADAGERRRLVLFGAGALGLSAAALAAAPALPPILPAALLPRPTAFAGLLLFAVAPAWALLARFLELMTENRRATDRLAAAYVLLQEDARLRQLGTSAAGFSHEIRNYVASLKGNAILAGRAAAEGAAGPGGGAGAQAVREAAERLDHMTRDIADFSLGHVSRGRVPVSLPDLAEACLDRHFATARGIIRVSAPGGIPAVTADPEALERALLNCLRNALEAGAGAVEVRLRAFRDRVLVAIEDDGAGIPPEDLERVGMPFFTGRAGRGGTGLGCSLAARALAAHGGSFRAYSKNALGGGSRGAVVTWVLPAVLSAGAAGPVSGLPRDVVVAVGPEAARAGALPPLLNLGLRPHLVPAGAWPPGLRGRLRDPLLLLESGPAVQPPPDWPGEAVLRFDARRVLHPPGGGAAPRLLSEEELARLLSPASPPTPAWKGAP